MPVLFISSGSVPFPGGVSRWTLRLLLIAALMALFSGCGSSKDSASEESVTVIPHAVVADEPATVELTTVTTVREDGTEVLGIDFDFTPHPAAAKSP